MDDVAKYRELVELYGTYGDEELVGFGQGIADLTPMAQEVLKGELTRRQLKLSEPLAPAQIGWQGDDRISQLRAYAEMAPEECVFEYQDRSGASAASLALEETGIDSVVLEEGDGRFGKRGPCVVVAPEDAEGAALVLSQPLVRKARTEAERSPEEFALPRCPACGGEEVLLESVDPVNHWHCDECGKSWIEGSAVLTD